MEINWQTGELGTYTGYTEATNTGGRAIRFEPNGIDIDNVPILAVPKRDMDKPGKPSSGKPQPGDILILKSQSTGKFTVAVAADTGGLSEADGDLGRQTAANLGLNLTKSGRSISYAEGMHKGFSIIKDDIQHAVIVSTGTSDFDILERGDTIDEARTLRKFTSEDSIAFTKVLNERIKTEGLTEDQAAAEISKFYDGFRKSEKGTHAYEALAKVTGKDFQSMELAYLQSIPPYLKAPENLSDKGTAMAEENMAIAAVLDKNHSPSEVKLAKNNGQPLLPENKNVLNSAEMNQFIASFKKVQEAVANGDIIEKGDKGAAARALQEVIRANQLVTNPDIADDKLVGVDGKFGGGTKLALEELQTEIGVNDDGRFGKTTLGELEKNLPQELQLALKQAAPAAQQLAATAPQTPQATPAPAASAAQSAGKTLYIGDSNSMMAGQVAGAERYSQVAASVGKAPKVAFDESGNLITSTSKPQGLAKYARAVPDTALNAKDLNRVVVFAGTNDAWKGANADTVSANVAGYVEGIAKGVRSANPNASIVVVLPQPELPGKDTNVLVAERQAILDKVYELRESGAKIDYVDPIKVQGKSGLHYTREGYEEINAKVNEVAQNLESKPPVQQEVAAKDVPKQPAQTATAQVASR